MSGLYQLLPWKEGTLNGFDVNSLADPKFWKSGVDAERLHAFFGWAKSVDTSFFNDRTAIILGDHPTVGGVEFQDGKLVEVPSLAVSGDGTVPESCSRLPGVRSLRLKALSI